MNAPPKHMRIGDFPKYYSGLPPATTHPNFAPSDGKWCGCSTDCLCPSSTPSFSSGNESMEGELQAANPLLPESRVAGRPRVEDGSLLASFSVIRTKGRWDRTATDVSLQMKRFHTRLADGRLKPGSAFWKLRPQ